MRSHRVLFVHAGGGKTGSSALQSALAEKSDLLAAQGISYVNIPLMWSHYAITSGNGAALFDLIATPRWKDEGAALVESLLGSCTIGICSSEFLGSMSPGNWRKLLATAVDLQIDIRVIFFVRPAGSYLVSCYNQDVKRGGTTVTLDEYLVDATWHHLEALKTLDAVLPSASLRVLNYEACASDLAGALANAFPELAPAGPILHHAARRVVNRSLDEAEISIVQMINRQLGSKAGESLSDKLIYAAPDKPSGTGMSNEQAETVAAKYADGTSWINARFFDEETEFLPLCSGVRSRHPASAKDVEQALTIALDWAVERCAQPSETGAVAIRDALLRIDWQNTGLAAIPPDFDPFAYLILNEDIVRAKVPPYLHYHSSGQFEDRAYRYPQPTDAQHDADIGNAIAAFGDRIDTGSSTIPMDRLRFQYQVEGLLQSFAARERDYLDDIRKLIERAAFGRAEMREELTKATQGAAERLVGEGLKHHAEIQSAMLDLRSALLQTHELGKSLVNAASEENAAAFERLGQAIAASGEANNRKFDTLRNEIRDHVERLMASLAEQRTLASDQTAGIVRTAIEEIVETVEQSRTAGNETIHQAAHANADAIVELGKAGALANAEILNALNAMQAEQARLNDELATKDVELERHRKTLSRYREAGSLGLAWWGIRRSQRP